MNLVEPPLFVLNPPQLLQLAPSASGQIEIPHENLNMNNEINIFEQAKDAHIVAQAFNQFNGLQSQNFFITEQEFENEDNDQQPLQDLNQPNNPSPPKTQISYHKPMQKVRPLSGYPTVGIRPQNFVLGKLHKEQDKITYNHPDEDKSTFNQNPVSA